MTLERRWNGTDGGKSEVLVANLSQCHSGLSKAPGFPVEKPATNCLSHDTASSLLPPCLSPLFTSFILRSVIFHSSQALSSNIMPLLPFVPSLFYLVQFCNLYYTECSTTVSLESYLQITKSDLTLWRRIFFFNFSTLCI